MKRLIGAGTALLAAGCAHGEDPHRAPLIAYRDSLPTAYVGAIPPSQDGAASAVTGSAGWWRSARDPLLETLVERALEANNDLAAAAARVGQARAQARIARGAQLPRLDAALQTNRSENLRGGGTGGTGGAGGSGGNTRLEAEIDFGWDPDLFGRLRADRRAALADLRAAGLDLENVRRIVVNDLVRSYVAYRVIEARLANAELSRKAQQDISDATERRYNLGLAVETDRQQARLQLLQVRALLPRLADERNQLRNRIAVLLGQAPQELTGMLDVQGGIPAFAGPPALGVPADLVRQRPDVAAAESRLLAAGERIGAARAALLPQLTLGGSLTSAASSPAGLIDTIIGQAFGRIAQSLFAGGARRAEVARNRALADEALADYRTSVLGALQSVENALSALRSAEERLVLDREGVEAARRAAENARRQYELGLIDFFVLLAAEQNLLAQRDQFVATQADHASATADLYAALGN